MSYFKEVIIQGSGNYYYQDKATSAIPITTYEHHEVHDGNHFYIQGFSGIVTSGNEINFSVVTPAGSKWANMLWRVYGTTQMEIRVFEGGTISGGTAITPVNNNRNSNTVSILTVKSNSVVSGATPTSGTLIASHSAGWEAAGPVATDIGGDAIREEELILKSGTTYLWSFKSVGSNIFDYTGTWYEHADRIQQF